MADSERGSESRVQKAVSLSANDLQAIDPEVLKELGEKYGLEVEIRSTSVAIDQILSGLGRVAGGMQAAEFTRGFDRTSDMYWKSFDRDYATGLEDLVGQPREHLGRIALADALKRFSLEELARLKNVGD